MTVHQTPPSGGFVEGLGPRAERRAEPRFTIALAGAGCALAVLGTLIISLDNVGGDSGDGLDRIPGLLLSALLVAGGMLALANARSGPMATAGVLAAALGVPSLMVFITLSDTTLPLYNTDAILLVATLAWATAWAVGPGRGRPFFLGAALIGAWASLLQLVEGYFDAPFAFFGAFAPGPGTFPIDDGFGGPGGGFGGGFGGGPSLPDPTTAGMLSLLVGVTYLVVGRRFDRAGQAGVGTPFAVAVLPCLALGLVSLAGDLEAAGTGFLTAVLGVALAAHGATVGRRLTTWVGGGAAALGLAIFLADMTDDATIAGMLYLAAGIAMVAAAHGLTAALDEPDETEPGPSSFGGARSPGQGAASGGDAAWAASGQQGAVSGWGQPGASGPAGVPGRPPAQPPAGTWAPPPPPPGTPGPGSEDQPPTGPPPGSF